MAKVELRPRKKGSSEYWIGVLRDSEDREKSFGAPFDKLRARPEVQIAPLVALIPKGRFFSPDDSKPLTCNGHLLINRMKQKK